MSTSVLLHSLTFYRELIADLAAIPASPDIVEIGSESGEMSRELAVMADRRGGKLFIIEPNPSDLLRELESTHASVVVIEGSSPQALDGLPPAGLYVVDGDHNYTTVRCELERIFAGSPTPLVVLHDVGWPAGRRDQYYAPDRLPEESVHAHSFRHGVFPGDPHAHPDRGFRGMGSFAWALHEGGPRNGVRTAIEDVVADHGGLAFLSTPMVFGLGVVGCAPTAQWSRVEAAMAPYVNNPTLERAERNRLDLLLRVISDRDELRRPSTRRVAVRNLRNSLLGLLRVPR